jgi:hypothetical protein
VPQINAALNKTISPWKERVGFIRCLIHRHHNDDADDRKNEK